MVIINSVFSIVFFNFVLASNGKTSKIDRNEEESNLFLRFLQKGSNNPKKLILSFGDSITAGYTRYWTDGPPNGKGKGFHPYTIQLNKMLSKFNVEAKEHGHVAMWLKNMVNQISIDLSQESYSYAIIWAGTIEIDNEPYIMAETIFAAVKYLHEKCHERGIKTFAVTVFQNQEFYNNSVMEKLRVKFNKLLTDFANLNKETEIINLDAFFKWETASAKERETISDGGIHFTPKGYDLLGKYFFKIIYKSIKTWRNNKHITIDPKRHHISVVDIDIE